MKTGLWHNLVTSFLVVLACLSIFATTFLVWFHQTALNTNQFVSIVSTSTEDPAVIESIGTRLSTQIVVALDVENRLVELLPDRLDRLAAPATNALQNLMSEAVSNALSNPDFQETWQGLLTTTHSGLLAFLRGDTTNVQIVDGSLTIDLIGVADVALQRLKDDGVIPETIAIPDVSAEPNRQAALDRLSTALSTNLPEDFGIVRIANAERIQTASTVVKGIDLLVVVMIIVSAVLGLLAIRWANRNSVAVVAMVVGVTTLAALMMVGLSFLSGRAAEVIEAPDGHALLAAIVGNLSESLTDWLAVLVTIAVAIGVLAVVWHYTFGRRRRQAEPASPS